MPSAATDGISRLGLCHSLLEKSLDFLRFDVIAAVFVASAAYLSAQHLRADLVISHREFESCEGERESLRHERPPGKAMLAMVLTHMNIGAVTNEQLTRTQFVEIARCQRVRE